jgi:Tfp pilus assembly protein FimT
VWWARAGAFTLVEMIVVMSFLAMFVVMAQVHLFGALRRSTFKSQVQDFISAMQMAASGAAETGRRYEVIVDITDQRYLLREISGSNLAEVYDEEIILDGQFGDSCRVSYVEFDDADYTNEGEAKFRVGHAGWMYGGKIVFLDESEQPHTVAVSRLTPIVQLIDGDPELMRPKAKNDVPPF